MTREEPKGTNTKHKRHENVVLIIPLVTAQLQSQMANVHTARQVNAIPNFQWNLRVASHGQRVSVTKGRVEIDIRRLKVRKEV